MNQKGYVPILFLVGVLVLSGLIVGGAFYFPRTKPGLVKNSAPIGQKNAQSSISNNSFDQSQGKVIPSSPSALILSPTPMLLTYKIQNKSMLPDYEEGQIWEFKEYSLDSPARGNVVKLMNPVHVDTEIIKRVIGMPGEKIKIEKGHIYLNNKLLDEPYLAAGTITLGSSFLDEGVEYMIPPTQFFIVPT